MTRQYCDICGEETRTEPKDIIVSFSGNYTNKKTFDICGYCKEKLEDVKRQAELDFVKKSVFGKKFFDGVFTDFGPFRMVGTAEQGGEKCPHCGHVNNSYTFKGICQKCGYTQQKKKY